MQTTVEFIKSKIKDLNLNPETAMILGSGLGDIAKEIEGISIPYSEIPNFPISKVEGHAGCLVIGKLCGKDVIAMQGRFHFYEGYPLERIVFPIKVMKLLGVKKLIVTNAAGGINENFNPGDLMIITDHINLLGTNPLIGTNDSEIGPRFVDMSEAYCKKWIETAENIMQRFEVKHQKGVYASVTGPSYETPAEIRMIRGFGADAVGMSTVPEVIAANHAGIKVLGISCITNMACGILEQPLCHEEVIETAAKVKSDFIKVLKTIIAES